MKLSSTKVISFVALLIAAQAFGTTNNIPILTPQQVSNSFYGNFNTADFDTNKPVSIGSTLSGKTINSSTFNSPTITGGAFYSSSFFYGDIQMTTGTKVSAPLLVTKDLQGQQAFPPAFVTNSACVGGATLSFGTPTPDTLACSITLITGTLNTNGPIFTVTPITALTNYYFFTTFSPANSNAATAQVFITTTPTNFTLNTNIPLTNSATYVWSFIYVK